MATRYPCGGPSSAAPATSPSASDGEPAARATVHVRRVDECETLDELFTHCLPAFGGGLLRRVYTILDQAIGAGCPLTVAVAGPVTVSGQHHTWLIPLLETGWVAYLSTTDAVCYHDGHRSLDGHRDPIFEVPIFGDDGALRDEGTIRVTDMGFEEQVLLDQDRFLTACLLRPELQKKMTGTELRYLLGKLYGAQEQQNGITPGLLSTCHRLAVPIFVGAPGDGSVFLNAMKLWAMRRAGLLPPAADGQGFDLDLQAEVFEACAYHRWGLFDHPAQALATLILGGGVPKNYNLQPEPALSQVLGLPDIRGYAFDVQIVSAPVTDGSLSSCPPAEAVTWGKVDKDLYQKTTESVQADYSMVMPFLIKALLDNRARYQRWAERMGEEALFEKHPKARGYLRPSAGYRLFEQRDALVSRLVDEVKKNGAWLGETLRYPLAGA
ncbi:MAG: deoxyhypusine synthase family protein [Polyangia bacterium]